MCSLQAPLYMGPPAPGLAWDKTYYVSKCCCCIIIPSTLLLCSPLFPRHKQPQSLPPFSHVCSCIRLCSWSGRGKYRSTPALAAACRVGSMKDGSEEGVWDRWLLGSRYCDVLSDNDPQSWRGVPSCSDVGFVLGQRLLYLQTHAAGKVCSYVIPRNGSQNPPCWCICSHNPKCFMDRW